MHCQVFCFHMAGECRYRPAVTSTRHRRRCSARRFRGMCTARYPQRLQTKRASATLNCERQASLHVRSSARVNPTPGREPGEENWCGSITYKLWWHRFRPAELEEIISRFRDLPPTADMRQQMTVE